MDNAVLYCKRNLHVGYPFMLGDIVKMKFGTVFDMVTVKYKERGIRNKTYKVYKVQSV
jgi:hypothetical protein